MSKKTRKKVARKNTANAAIESDKSTDNQSALKSPTKAPSAAGRSYLSTVELENRYQYVKDDLKNIAIIAIPLLLILTIASFVVNI